MTRTATAFLVAALTTSACAVEDAPLELPVPVEQASPFVYPDELWDEGVEGQAVVMVHVTTEGAVDSVYVRSTSGHEAMDSAAVAGARELRFEPGRRGADPVEVWVRLPVRFSKSPPSEAELEAEAEAEARAQGARL
ncbi:MAG TPA: energy transducer TonB [Longimicrobiales bacterium]|nr:energy transducer TonB [Longimicrobiales bacterium]